MNRTVTITSKNHKYANTYGEIFVYQIFALIMKIVKILQIESFRIGKTIFHVINKWKTISEIIEKGR